MSANHIRLIILATAIPSLYFPPLARTSGSAAAQTPPAASTNVEFDSIIRGFDGWQVISECPQKSYSIDRVRGEAEFCLDLADSKFRRCEIALHKKELRDHQVKLSYEIFVPPSWPLMTDWIIVNQINSRPDPGESWRCPIISFEVFDNTFRMYSRSDITRISDTSDSTCAGKSIKSRKVFSNIEYQRGRWVPVSIDLTLSLINGRITANIDGREVGAVAGGPNTYNDTATPYLKFGVYKPPPRGMEGKYCVRYRKITLEQGR